MAGQERSHLDQFNREIQAGEKDLDIIFTEIFLRGGAVRNYTDLDEWAITTTTMKDRNGIYLGKNESVAFGVNELIIGLNNPIRRIQGVHSYDSSSDLEIVIYPRFSKEGIMQPENSVALVLTSGQVFQIKQAIFATWPEYKTE